MFFIFYPPFILEAVITLELRVLLFFIHIVSLFIGFYYVIINVWKFANDYPGWAIAISVVLIWTYIYLIDEM